MNKTSKYIILPILLILLIYCSNNEFTYLERYDPTRNSIEVIADLMGLVKIKELKNGYVLRIWYSDFDSDTLKLATFSKLGESWISKEYYIKANLNDSGYIESINYVSNEKAPLSGWPIFGEQIDSLIFKNNLRYDSIPKYMSCTDDWTNRIIEISRSGKYERFEYPCYDVNLIELELAKLKRVNKINSLRLNSGMILTRLNIIE